MQEWLQSEYDFFIVTRNHDLGSSKPYSDLVLGRWCKVGNSRVWYLPSTCYSTLDIRNAVTEVRPDVIYCQSALDFRLTVLPLLMRRIGVLSKSYPFVVAPRGEFSPGALTIKSRKKNTFLALARHIDLYKDVVWQATKTEEQRQIEELWGVESTVRIAPNLPSRNYARVDVQQRTKEKGHLRIVFLSRIARMKNLIGAIRILSQVNARIEFDVFGVREDEAYWSECEQLIDTLPPKIKARYLGVIQPEEAVPTLGKYDLLLLPTLGENFGHVILEAMISGCPVVVSDQTPWRNLKQKRVGADIPLKDHGAFVNEIENFANMGATEFSSWSAAAHEFGVAFANDESLAEQTRDMFKYAQAT